MVKKAFIQGIVALFVVTIISYGMVDSAEASPSSLVVTQSEANELGQSLTTTQNVTRDEMWSFYDDAVYAENNEAFVTGVATSIALSPLRRVGISISSGAVASYFSTFIIDHGSDAVVNAIRNKNSARGQDNIYDVDGMSISPSS